ncbi:MAG TPA: hypothetical protein VFP97_12635 [Chitinophagaceae bacterium]|nr:hypothetical protein [Chitinophagaceae bacterium]
MKKVKMALIALLIASGFAACNKDSDDAAAVSSPVEGTYSGKYGFGNDAPDQDFKFKVSPGGVFQEISISSGNTTGQGTWTVNGNTLTATYTMLFSPYNKYSVSGNYEPATQKMTGTWGYDNNPADGGKIEMNKQ